MPLYNQVSADLATTLINQSNPQLPVPLTSATVTYGVPVPVVPVGNAIQNTSVVVSAGPGSSFIGKAPLTYRRIDLGVLFRGVKVAIKKYSASALTGTTAFNLYDLLPTLNSLYGLMLTTSDLPNTVISRGAQVNGVWTSTTVITVLSSSLGYIGSFTLVWTDAPQDVSTMITSTSLAGRVFPAPTPLSAAIGAAVMNCCSFGIDFSGVVAATPWDGYPSSIGAGVAYPNTALFLNNVFAQINSVLGTSFPTNTAAGNFGGAGQLSLYTLPSAPALAAIPEANSKYYNHAIILRMNTAPLQAAYGVGYMIIHFNI